VSVGSMLILSLPFLEHEKMVDIRHRKTAL